MSVYNKEGDLIHPRIPVHPGEVLSDELLARGISLEMLCAKSDINYHTLQQIIRQKAPIDIDTAKKLSCLRISPYFWLNLQQSYDQHWKREMEKCKSIIYYFKNYWRIYGNQDH